MKDGTSTKGASRLGVLRRGLGLMTARERASALGIVALMMVAGFVESIVVALVIPLVYVIVDPATFAKTRIGQMLVDMLGGSSIDGMFPWLAATLVALLLLSGVLNGVATWAVETHSARCRDRLAADLLRRCIAAPYLWLASHKTAVLTRHLFEDVRMWRREFVHAFIMIIQSAIMIISPASVAIALAPWNGLAALVLVGAVCGWIVLLFRRAIRNNAAASRRASDALMQTLLQILGGIREIKVSGRPAYFVSRFDRLHSELNRLTVRTRLLGSAPASLINLLGQIGFLATALVLWSSDLPSTEITVQLALIGVVVSRVVPAFNRLAANVSVLFKAAPFVESLVDFINEIDAVGERTRAGNRPVPAGWRTVTLDDVTFQYPGASRPACVALRSSSNGAGSTVLSAGRAPARARLSTFSWGLSSRRKGGSLSMTCRSAK
ncbi:MAG: ABC transporter ATP-binding protein [Bacteroidales bacterium]|nr:ABC transporter ATP-binding protein [Bacteroidales bacterium]